MTNGKLSSLLNLKNNKNETAFEVLTEPNLIPCRRSASVVIFPKARGLSEAAKVSNPHLQTSKLDI